MATTQWRILQQLPELRVQIIDRLVGDTDFQSLCHDHDRCVDHDGGKMELVHESKGVAGKRSTTPKDCYTVGCGWPALYKWRLPRDLRSGFYVVVFSVMRGEERIEQEAGFVVRAAKPKSPIALMLATSTRRSYNDWGGGSYYGKPGVASGATGAATGDIAIVPRVHLHRPWARDFIRLPNSAARFTVPADPPRAMGESIRYFHNEFALSNGYSKWCMAAGWAAFDRHFVIWAESNGYEMDFITQEDLHDNADSRCNQETQITEHDIT